MNDGANQEIDMLEVMVAVAEGIQALVEGEDLVAQPSLQGTFLIDYRRPTFNSLLLDSNH